LLSQSVGALQVCPYGLYAEQLSGTAFTAPRGWVAALVLLNVCSFSTLDRWIGPACACRRQIAQSSA
jgi:homogentisate 1,2-dioxygenase